MSFCNPSEFPHDDPRKSRRRKPPYDPVAEFNRVPYISRASIDFRRWPVVTWLVDMRWILFLFAAVCVPPNPVRAQVDVLQETAVPDSVRQQILGFVTSYYDALSDRDWDRFRSHFWPGGTIVTIWQPPGEKSERVHSSTVLEFIERAPEGPGSREIFEERMTEARVHVQGNLATVFARYHARFGDPGEIMEWDGMDSFSLMRFGREWRIVSLSFAPDG